MLPIQCESIYRIQSQHAITMSTARFQLRLLTTWKAVLLIIGGLIALMTVIFGGIIYNENRHIVGIAGDIAWFVLVFFGGGYGLVQLGKRVCTYPAHIAVGDKKLTITTNNETITDLFYNDIRSYRYQAFNGGYELRIRLLNGDVQKLNSGGQLVPTADTISFASMAAAFEAAIAKHQQLQGDFAPVMREKTFFEKPVATFLLFIYASLVIVVIGIMVLKHKFMPNALSSLGLFISFAAAWRAARRKQQNG